MTSTASRRRPARAPHPSRSPRAPQLPQAPAELTGAALTREKLLQAAHELLFEHGGTEPSVSQICERAGVQVAMVSYCFGGKAQLFEALVERAVQGIVGELERLAAQGLEPEQMLRVHVRAMVKNFVRFPYVRQLFERSHSRDRRVVRAATLFAEPALAFYRDLFARGARLRKFRKVDATLFFFSLLGMCEFLFTARALFPTTGEAFDDALVERFSEHTVELILQGVTRGSDPGK
ncbi:TetR family transcriptional regulator [Pendulispora brunnea]|uniref:TetR family transcriptional regulator n=1 Tax=Pendulispora brunnea TaxID=2905690 RepID=A0ABZ2JV92_9BACT